MAGEHPGTDTGAAESRRAEDLGRGMDVELVYRLVPDRDQAADAVQEAFFSAYRNLAAFRGGSVRSWLGRIAVNAAMDIQRSRRRRPFNPYPELEAETWQPPALESEEPEARMLEVERSRALAAALGALPFDQRNCIVLFLSL